jgi:hypothetical protein
MQRENEAGRVVLEGRRADDGTRCTLVAIREINGTWALYPHGLTELGARLRKEDAATLGRAIVEATT